MKCALVVDDHPVTHLGCRRLLAEAGYQEVLEAREAESACRLAARHRPSLIVLDLGLPGVGGLQLIPQLRERAPEARILIFSMNEGAVFAAKALQAGVSGYLAKSSAPEDFAEAVRTIEAGRVFLERGMATELALLGAGVGGAGRAGGARDPLQSLSAREHQVLRLIGQGRSHGQIAEEIHLSYKTVANTCAILKRKLGARSLSELIRLALEQGMA